MGCINKRVNQNVPWSLTHPVDPSKTLLQSHLALVIDRTEPRHGIAGTAARRDGFRNDSALETTRWLVKVYRSVESQHEVQHSSLGNDSRHLNNVHKTDIFCHLLVFSLLYTQTLYQTTDALQDTWVRMLSQEDQTHSRFLDPVQGYNTVRSDRTATRILISRRAKPWCIDASCR